MRFLIILFLWGVSSAFYSSAYGQSPGDSCSVSAGTQNIAICDGSTYQSAIVMNVDGSVEFGKSIKVGVDTDPCDGDKKGALSYDAVNDIWQYCNGSGWTPFKAAARAYNMGDSFGGGICAGVTRDGSHTLYNLIAAPGGCTDSATPNCAGGTDTISKTWGLALNIGVRNLWHDGAANTSAIGAAIGVFPAGNYCENMVYGGFTDWYLPSGAELLQICDALGGGGHGFSNATAYHSSTDFSNGNVYTISFSDCALSSSANKILSSRLVRCVRRAAL